MCERERERDRETGYRGDSLKGKKNKYGRETKIESERFRETQSKRMCVREKERKTEIKK